MAERIVFFDIDGTLLNDEKELPESTIEAVYALKKNGIHVALATGRAPFMFDEIQKQLQIDNYVSYNGQYVLYENEVIYKRPIPGELLDRLEKAADRNDHPMVYMHHEGMTTNREDHAWVEESIRSLKVKLPEFGTRGSEDIYQAMLYCPEEEEQQYIEAFRNELKFIRWHPYSLDVLAFGGSKAEGIAAMVKRMGIDMSRVYAFGDELNDLEMLQQVGTGVAMGNAPDVVKSVADFVTKDVAEDGIYYALKQLKLI